MACAAGAGKLHASRALKLAWKRPSGVPTSRHKRLVNRAAMPGVKVSRQPGASAAYTEPMRMIIDLYNYHLFPECLQKNGQASSATYELQRLGIVFRFAGRSRDYSMQ